MSQENRGKNSRRNNASRRAANVARPSVIVQRSGNLASEQDVQQLDEISCIDLTEVDDEVIVEREHISLPSEDLSVEVISVTTRNSRSNRRVRSRSRSPLQTDVSLVDITRSPTQASRPAPAAPAGPAVTLPEASPVRVIKCPICLDDHRTIMESRQLVSTTCGHIYCSTCLKEAIKNRKCCPTCRKKLTVRGFHPIFL